MNYLALRIGIAQLAVHGSYANMIVKFLIMNYDASKRGGCSEYFSDEDLQEHISL